MAPPEPGATTIRLLASLLAAVILAVGLAVAAASLLLAARHGPGRTAPPTSPKELAPLTAPATLGADAAFARVATPAAARRPPQATTLHVRLRNLPPSARTATMGVATFETLSGASFTWTPLTDANTDGAVMVATVSLSDAAERTVTLATEQAFARRGYVACSRITPPLDAGTADLELDAAMHPTHFALATVGGRAGPLRVVRLDDPQWLPMAHLTGLSVTAGAPVTMTLGAGAYELRDPIDPERRQRFDVPAASPIVIDRALSVVRADRP